MCRGKIRIAARCTCKHDKGGTLLTNDVDEKTGDLAKESLINKHPTSRDILINDIPACESILDFKDIIGTDKYAEYAAKDVSGSSSPSGLDTQLLSY